VVDLFLYVFASANMLAAVTTLRLIWSLSYLEHVLCIVLSQ